MNGFTKHILFLLFLGTFFLSGSSQALAQADTVTISFLGDIMQHDNQRHAALKEDGSFDYSDYFRYIADDLKASDVAVANLETPVGAEPFKGYPAFSAPAQLALEAAASGIDLLLLANNHICDRGARGIDSTISICERNGIYYTGASRGYTRESLQPFVFDCKGIRIGIVNMTYGTNGIPTPKGYQVARMDSNAVKSAIMQAELALCDIIIAAPHWGNEYQTFPSYEQKKWEKFLFRNGVDIIAGGHPHVPQPTYEKPMDKAPFKQVTAYSMGNYISNMTAEFTRVGLMLQIQIIKHRYRLEQVEIGEVKVIPLWCTRPGEVCENFSVVPMVPFLERPDAFSNENAYLHMKRYYHRIKSKKLDICQKKQ